MLKKKIPATGEDLPVIGMGTWQTFDVADARPLRDVLSTFVELGGSVLDSSPMYGRSESVSGELMSDLALRPKIFVATKVWTSGKREGVWQMEDSFKKMRVETVDLMQVHNLLDVETHLDTLAEWKRDGRVRYVGVTHYTASAHDALAKMLEKRPIDFVQVNYSAREREAERRLLSVAAERKVAVIANRPFASGELLRSLKNKPLPAFAKELDCESWAQLLLKYVVAHPAVTCAIPATSKVAHVRDNMRAGEGRMPDEKLRARIAAEVEK